MQQKFWIDLFFVNYIYYNYINLINNSGRIKYNGYIKVYIESKRSRDNKDG